MLEDRMTSERAKNVNDLDGIRQILKQFDNRIIQLENRPIPSMNPLKEKIT